MTGPGPIARTVGVARHTFEWPSRLNRGGSQTYARRAEPGLNGTLRWLYPEQEFCSRPVPPLPDDFATMHASMLGPYMHPV